MKKNAFTLMELIVVMTVIIALGGILLPQVNRVLTQARESKAKAELEHIKGAMLAYKNDTGELPPKSAVFGEANITAAILNALLTDDSAGGWDGPYIDKSVFTDPWGNVYRYADNDGTASKAISYLLSYGPNGSNNMTNPHLITASNGGDDIYVVVYNDGD